MEDHITRIRARNYGSSRQAATLSRPDPAAPELVLSGRRLGGERLGDNNPAAAALLTEAGSSSDTAKIKDLLRKLELLAVEDSSYIPLTAQFSLSGIRHARGVLEAVNPGEYLFVKTTPPLPGS